MGRGCLLLALALPPIATADLFWASGGEIMRANYDGSGAHAIVTDQGDVDGVEFALGHVYWADPAESNLKRAKHDGSEVEVLLEGLDNPFGIAVDAANEWLFWTEFSPARVVRARLDGSEVQDMTTNSLSWPTTVRSDGAGLVYFSDAGSESAFGGTATGIYRFNASQPGAAAAETVLTRADFSSNSANQIYGFALQDDSLYYGATKSTSGTFSSVVQRLWLAGEDAGEIDPVYAGVSAVYGLELDAATNSMWWTDFVGDQVWVGTVDGEADPEVLFEDGDSPWGVVAWRREDRCGSLLCVALP